MRLIYTCVKEAKIERYTVKPGDRVFLISMTSDYVVFGPIEKEGLIKYQLSTNDFSEAFRLEMAK